MKEVIGRPGRIKIMHIPAAILVPMIAGWGLRSDAYWLEVTSDVPEDLRITGAQWNWQDQSVALTVESESFPEVGAGFTLQELLVTYTRIQGPPKPVLPAGVDDGGPLKL